MTHPLNDQKIQSSAILLHKSTSSYRLDVTVHDVIHLVTQEGSEVSQLGAGRVLGVEEKTEMASILNESSGAALTLFDKHILAATPYAIAWWIPASTRTLHFRDDGDMETVTVDFPSHVGVFCRGRLYFAAVKANKARPSGSTPLFNSPLPNLYSGGNFCGGTAAGKLPANASIDHIPSYEAFLFDTVNTHVGSCKPLEGITKTKQLVSLYQKEASVPRDRLVPMDFTLGKWIKAIDEQRIKG